MLPSRGSQSLLGPLSTSGHRSTHFPRWCRQPGLSPRSAMVLWDPVNTLEEQKGQQLICRSPWGACSLWAPLWQQLSLWDLG